MAYAYFGTGKEEILMSDGENRVKTFDFPNTNTPLCILHNKQLIGGKSCDVYALCAPLQPNGTQYEFEYTEVWTSPSGTIKKNETINVTVNYPSSGTNWGSTGISSDPTWNKYYKEYKFNSALPIFSSESDVTNYMKTGDTSNSEVDTSTDFTIYIDGESNPLYKIKWDCKDVPSSNFSTIKFYVGELDNVAGLIIGKDDFKINYDKRTYKTNYNDLSKIADLETILGHQSICLIMQFNYFADLTVLPTSTSDYMYCVLHYKQMDGKMYSSYGHCKLVDTRTWQQYEGDDNSTITIKDGQAGADGYTNDDDDGYNDGEDNDETDDNTGDVSAGIGVLTSTFKMTKERLVQLGQFLWGSNIFDKFSLVNNNPIENIISCKSIPINTDGTNQEIVLGNVATGVNGEKISNNFAKQTIGSIAINEHYHNFLDYAPYTNIILYLPYIGFKELDTTLVMNKTLQVIYTVDAITGGCLAQVYVNNVRLYEFTGNVGIDIPITASNRAQVEAGYIQAGVGATASALGGNVGSAVTSLLNSATSQYHYSSTGNPSPMCVASTNRTCYVIIDRPNYQNLKAFNHTRGRKCYLSKTISTLHGFTICDSNIDLSGINATQSELEELKEILSSGFYV